MERAGTGVSHLNVCLPVNLYKTSGGRRRWKGLFASRRLLSYVQTSGGLSDLSDVEDVRPLRGFSKEERSLKNWVLSQKDKLWPFTQGKALPRLANFICWFSLFMLIWDGLPSDILHGRSYTRIRRSI